MRTFLTWPLKNTTPDVASNSQNAGQQANNGVIKMDVYIDCEFNGFGGELISMGLVSDHGHEFYGVLGCDHPCKWVEENVMPILNEKPVPLDVFQWRLQNYLHQFECVNIIADYPEDIQRFCAALIIGPGECLNTPPLSMKIVRVSSQSALPHNALEDARGIREALNPKTLSDILVDGLEPADIDVTALNNSIAGYTEVFPGTRAQLVNITLK